MGVVGARWGQVLLGGAVVALACGGCDGREYGPGDNPTEVTDVTGVAFGWVCTTSGCGVQPAPDTPAPDPCDSGQQAGFSYAYGRFFSLCSVCFLGGASGGWTSTPGQCRILACQTSADCPVMFRESPADVYACVDGLCENADTSRRPRDPLQRVDAEELCFATHPRADTTTLTAPVTVAVESELDASCTGSDPLDTCTLPVDCRAP